MNLSFFNLKASFESAYSIPESVNKLVNAVKNQQDSFKLEKESESNLLLLIGTGSMIYYNIRSYFHTSRVLCYYT